VREGTNGHGLVGVAVGVDHDRGDVLARAVGRPVRGKRSEISFCSRWREEKGEEGRRKRTRDARGRCTLHQRA
jgi:hypothetical protein